MAKGWIAIHRDIYGNWIWKCREPFDRRSAWIDLLLLATYADNKEMYKGELVQRKRGEIYCSILWLADRWHWSRKKTKGFITALENDKMVTTKSTTKGTTIRIENYNKWQSVGTTEGTTQFTTQGTTRVQPRNIPKKGKQSITKKNNFIYRQTEKNDNQDSGIWAMTDDELKVLRGEA